MPSVAVRKLQDNLYNTKMQLKKVRANARKPQTDEITSAALKVGGGALAGFVSQTEYNKIGNNCEHVCASLYSQRGRSCWFAQYL